MDIGEHDEVPKTEVDKFVSKDYIRKALNELELLHGVEDGSWIGFLKVEFEDFKKALLGE